MSDNVQFAEQPNHHDKRIRKKKRRIPKPETLRIVAIKPKNETMFSDLDTMEFRGLDLYRRVKKFAITMEGFIPLVEKEYDLITTSQRLFQKQISESMFVYYCVQHLYARAVTLKRERLESTKEEDSFERRVLSGNHSLPTPIESYIRGLGNVDDPAGLRYKISFPAWPLKTGDFGRIAPNTHWKYMAMPAPMIVAQRIQMDLAATRDQVRDWNLDETIRPAEEGAGLPTRNCLGWASAVALTNAQDAFLKGAGIMEDNFPVEYRQFYFNSHLFSKVSQAIYMIGECFKIAPQKPVSTSGSWAQCCWVEIEGDPTKRTRHGFYAERCDSHVVSAYAIEVKTVLASLILAYRVRKDEVSGIRPYSVYDFGGYSNVPIEYHNTRNTIYEFGNSDRWNIEEYTSSYTHKHGYTLAWLFRHKK